MELDGLLTTRDPGDAVAGVMLVRYGVRLHRTQIGVGRDNCKVIIRELRQDPEFERAFFT